MPYINRSRHTDLLIEHDLYLPASIAADGLS